MHKFLICQSQSHQKELGLAADCYLILCDLTNGLHDSVRPSSCHTVQMLLQRSLNLRKTNANVLVCMFWGGGGEHWTEMLPLSQNVSQG